MSNLDLLRPGASFLADAPSVIFTPEQFSADERLMIQTAEEFCRKEVLPRVEQIDAQAEGLMPSLIRSAGDLGLCGVDTADEYGGLGLGKNLAARILEFMSLNGSFSVTYGITSGISQVGLSLFGNADQKAEYLPRLTSGEWIGAYCLSEPNAGSDALSLTTRADRRGDTYVLNGTKMWISNAKWANFFLVMAKVDGDKLSAFLVERDFPGVTIAREEHKMGLKGSSTARVIFENAEVPARNLLYEEGLGHHVAFNALNIGRFKLASMSLGPARHALEVAIQYAHERKQFGKTLASFELIQEKIARMHGLFTIAESMIYRTGAMIDQAFTAYSQDIAGYRKAAEEYAIEASIVKVFATEVEGMIVDEALQIFGGYGFTEEFPVARHYRDARISRIYEGTNEINRLFIADRYHRRVKEGRIPPAQEAGNFIADLAARALRSAPQGQIQTAAQSDLLILAYAEQSLRLRTESSEAGNLPHPECAANFLELSAVGAYQRATGTPLYR